MDNPYIEDALNDLIGKRLQIESTDGSIRKEKLHSIRWHKLTIGDDQTTEYPFTLFFDPGEVDGMEVSVVRCIHILPE